MKLLPLNGGKVSLVDDKDFNLLRNLKWSTRTHGYAGRVDLINGKQHTVYVHRIVMNAPFGVDVDHINGNPLDNRKRNLRLCSRQQNSWNYAKKKVAASGYIGVSWNERDHKWYARIRHAGRSKHLGAFAAAIDAAKAYNDAATSYRGNFARLNKLS